MINHDGSPKDPRTEQYASYSVGESPVAGLQQHTVRPLRSTLEKLKRWPKTARHFEGREVRIFSAEWEAWWRHNGEGYTRSHDEAGVWKSLESAMAVSAHCGPEKRIEYEAV